MNKTSTIYFEILDFVSLAKKLEYCLLQKYEYKGESVFRGAWDKEIPRKGEVKLEDEIYQFFFHGSGITFSHKDKVLNYNRSLHQGLGVHFTPLIHSNYREKTATIDQAYQQLVAQNLIAQWMPEAPQSKVFYLI